MTTEPIPADASIDEIIKEERLIGVFDASLNRKQATALAHWGYSLKPGTVGTTEGAVFDILVKAEDEHTETFRASIARKIAKELVGAGCSL